MKTSRRLSWWLASLNLLVSLGTAGAYTVTTTADTGAGSLRQGISATPSGGSVDFNIPTTDPGYNSTTGIFTITVAGGELQIGRDLTINGPANAKIFVSGNNVTRVFNVRAGTVAITNLTITKGRVAGANGATATGLAAAVPGGSAIGGAILNAGALTLRNCTVSQSPTIGGIGGSGNGATNNTIGAPGGAATGGCIANQGTLVLINCTFNGNAPTGGRGGDGYSGSPAGVGGAADGGGVWNSGSATLINTTLAANSVLRGNGGGGAGLSPGGNGGNVTGGGFAQAGAANCVSRNTIVAGDSATGGTGGIATPGSGASSGANGTATGTDIYGAISSQGHNLIGRTDGNSGWVASDLLGGTTAGTKLDPLLGALQDNSGPTQTLRPAAGSAAIDNGDDAVLSAPFSLTSDQRGYTRKSGTHVDIGAVEIGFLQPGPTFTVTNTAGHDDGACTTDDCTFLEALNASNANRRCQHYHLRSRSLRHHQHCRLQMPTPASAFRILSRSTVRARACSRSAAEVSRGFSKSLRRTL